MYLNERWSGELFHWHRITDCVRFFGSYECKSDLFERWATAVNENVPLKSRWVLSHCCSILHRLWTSSNVCLSLAGEKNSHVPVWHFLVTWCLVKKLYCCQGQLLAFCGSFGGNLEGLLHYPAYSWLMSGRKKITCSLIFTETWLHHNNFGPSYALNRQNTRLQ